MMAIADVDLSVCGRTLRYHRRDDTYAVQGSARQSEERSRLSAVEFIDELKLRCTATHWRATPKIVKRVYPIEDREPRMGDL